MTLVVPKKPVSRLALFADQLGRCAFETKWCAELACPDRLCVGKVSVVFWTVCVASVVQNVC